MLRRFTTHAKPGNPHILAEDHPAAVEGRSLITKPAGAARDSGTVLKPGVNQRKIGGRVQKGAWKGFPIYTLTLEERRTCPRSCAEYLSCYGNNMHWPVRQQPGSLLEQVLEDELTVLQAKHPRGFVVRLHILGDFYSVPYVESWARWLEMFPALRVFGYSARPEDDPIGKAIAGMVAWWQERFSIRSSGGELDGVPAAIVVENENSVPSHAILCPAQTDKTECCATCALCWSTPKTIAFLRH